ncbi:MAG TPA: WD40 repeat domain-containing protein, partial [Pirellulales bacterium]|nr:WD40 repeat domain-containing protein [Pirellulales bacterium]
WLFTSDSQTVRRWDLAADDPTQSSRLVGTPGFIHSGAALSPDGRWLATMNRTVARRKAFVWDLQAEKLDEPWREFELEEQYLDQLRFSADSGWLIGRAWNAAWLWNLASQSKMVSPIVLQAKDMGISSVAIASGGRWAVTQGQSRAPNLWSLTNPDAKPTPRPLFDPKVAGIYGSQLSPDGKWFVAFDRANPSNFVARFWNLSADDPFASAREIPFDHRRTYGNTAVHFSANGQWLALAEGDRIKLWELAAEKWDAPSSTLSLSDASAQEAGDATQPGFVGPPATDSFQLVITDRDARTLLAIDQTGSIHAWNLNAKDPNRSHLVVGRHAGGGNINLELSPSGRWLVSTREGEPPRLWDLWRRNPRAAGIELRGHDGASYRSTYVAFGGGSLTAPAAALALQLPLVGIARQVRDSLNMGERWLVTRGYDATPRLWDLAAEDLRRAGVQTGAFKVDARDLAIRDDGNWVIWQGFTQLQVIDPDKKDRVASTINVRTGGFGGGWSSSDRSLSRDGRWLALRTGQSIGVYDLTSEQFSAKQIAEPSRPQSPAEMQPADEKNAAKKPAVWLPAVAGGRWLQQFFNPQLDQGPITVPGVHEAHTVVEIEPNKYVNALIISASGRWLLIQTGEHWRLWNVREKRAVPASIELGNDIIRASFSPNDRWLVSYKQVSGANRLEISIWDLESTSLRKSTTQHELGGNYSIGQNLLAFSDDCRWLASSTGGVRVWPIADDGTLGEAETLSTGQQSGGGRDIALSHDGRFVAAAENGAVRLWDRSALDTAVRQRDLHGHEQSVSRLAFSPDSQWLVSASHDGEVRLWDLRDEQLQDAMIALAIENERQQHVDFENLQFSADGRWLAA